MIVLENELKFAIELNLNHLKAIEFYTILV